MANIVNTQVLTDRLAKIGKEREALNAEEARIKSALEVFNEYAASAAGKAQPEIVPPVIEEEERRLGPARPAGTPTLFNMAYQVIADAEQRGEPGLSGQGIVDSIGKLYWPGVKGPQVLPSIYGFAKHGRLRKSEDGLFHTVRTKEASAEKSEGVSKPEAGGATNPAAS